MAEVQSEYRGSSFSQWFFIWLNIWQEGSRAHTDLKTPEEDSYCSLYAELHNLSFSITIHIESWFVCSIGITSVISVQLWSIIILEAGSNIYKHCLWLGCLLDLTLKSTYCAATLQEASTCLRLSVCALLCVTAPPAGAHSIFELLLIHQSNSVLSLKVIAGSGKHQCFYFIISLLCAKGSHSALTTQSPIGKHAK